MSVIPKEEDKNQTGERFQKSLGLLAKV